MRRVTRYWLAAPLLVIGGASSLASAGAGQAPEREANVIVYGDDPCPAAPDDAEIVVCARRPEEERYRIPEALRRSSRPAETSWTTRTEDLEAAQRDTRPDGCSVVGSFGQSGCTQQMVRDWYAERRLRRRTR
ncbi:MAG: hypothetical protein ACXWU1_01265 [Allosphingosinicella sp.]